MYALPIDLLVLGEADDVDFVREALAEAPTLKFEIEVVETPEQALEALSVPCHDVCVVARRAGEPSPLELVRRAREAGCISPMILLGESVDPEAVEEARRLGAVDYIDRARFDGVLLEHVLRHVLRYAQAHASLRQAIRENGQLTAALAALPIGVAITDPFLPDDPVVFVSPAFERLTGYEADEVIGRGLRFLQGPETEPAAVEALGRARAAGEEATRTLRHYRKDGTPFWSEVRTLPVFDEDGTCINHVFLLRDVTAQREATAHLDRDERCIHELVDRLAEPAGIRHEGRLVHANAALARLLGLPRAEDLAGRTVAALVRAEDRPALGSGGGGGSCLASARRLRLVRDDGREVAVEVRSAPISYGGAPAILDVLTPVG